MNLYREFGAVIDRLSSEDIEYAVCGGIAVALYGYVRFTYDLDILVQDDEAGRVTKVLRDLGFVLDAGRVPFDVGRPQERVIQRISKIEDDEF